MVEQRKASKVRAEQGKVGQCKEGQGNAMRGLGSASQGRVAQGKVGQRGEHQSRSARGSTRQRMEGQGTAVQRGAGH